MMKLNILWILALVLSSAASAATQGVIIQVARRLAMQANEPAPPKEYFVDIGARDGVREGDTLEVSRSIPVVEAQTAGSFHVMKVVLGEVKVTLVGETSSLARVLRLKPPSELPPMEFFSFVLGDQVELKSGLPFQ
jgi:hypothetical protein